MKASLCQPGLETTVRCQVGTFTTLHGSAESIEQWRRQPFSAAGQSFSVSFLKHSCDQTVLAMRSILCALEQPGWNQRSFSDWGVVAAPNFFGRSNLAQSIERYQDEGVWGVSPHIVPQHSLHAISGAISQALKIHGPNFGIGGGPNSSSDAFLIAAALLADGSLPGLWLVLTGHDFELLPSMRGRPAKVPVYQAIAMALTPAMENARGLQLSIGQINANDSMESNISLLPEFRLGSLLEAWSQWEEAPHGKWRLSDTHWVEWENVLHEREIQS